MKRRLHMLLYIFAFACGGIEPPAPTDVEGEEIILPGPYDRYLTATAEYETTQGVRPTLRFVFSDFIEPDELLDFGVVRLDSAGISNGGRVTWEMTTRTLTFQPFSDLVPGLRYRPSMDTSLLLSVTGAPMQSTDFATFLVDETVVKNAESAVVAASWRLVNDVLQAKCLSCHSDEQWQLNPLTHNSMVGRRSAQTDRVLVVPFAPADSYLLHKCIPDYPVRRFTVQPPPWSGAEPLTLDEVRLIERWITNGAPST